MKKIWPRKNIWMTALPVVLVNTVVRGYWVLLLSWPNGPMCTCATAHDLRSLTSIAWISPGTVLNDFLIECIYFFLSQVRKFEHLTFFFLRINFSDRFLFVLNKCDYNLQNSMTRCNLTKNKQVFFSNLLILIVVIEKTWKNPISKR